MNPPGLVVSRRAAGALTAAVLLVAGCGKEEPVAEAPVARPVKLLAVGGESSAEARDYPGRVAAVREASVAFEVGGRIVDLPVEEGQMVRTGAVLARLDDRDFEANLAAARADRQAAEADYLRYQDLLERDAVSRRDFESRQRNFEVAKSKIDIAKKALEDTVLRAPFAGRVARKLVDDFENVQSKQAIVLLQDASALEIAIDLPEADLTRGPRGEQVEDLASAAERLQVTAEVTLASAPGESFPATFRELATSADPATRTFEATFAFTPPGDVLILPGMTARVTLAAPAKAEDGVKIPSGAAVADDSGKPYVWKVDESSMTVSKAPVVLGELSGADVAVTSGLAPGDVIAVSGVHHLRAGMEITRFES
ncbi:MAG: efflux RND transporter periplasmic adaptor subunit [bacterium]|nr:efflux RND transporter periplasmic adaptor subunit [bacterium]